MGDNASGCCGFLTQCCPSARVQEHLTIAISNSCGTFSGSLDFDGSQSTSSSWVWTGTVNMQCRQMMLPCSAKTMNVKIVCEGPSCFAPTCFHFYYGCPTYIANPGITPTTSACRDLAANIDL